MNSLDELTKKERHLALERFDRKIKFSGDIEGCVPWEGAASYSGYGQFRIEIDRKKIIVLSHRFSYLVFNGDIPDELLILHSCHVRRCLNPDHLRTGTQVENMAEMRSAGRENKARGERSGRAKLTENDVLRIRSMEGSNEEIGKLFGVTPQNVRAIRNRKSWRHIQ